MDILTSWRLAIFDNMALELTGISIASAAVKSSYSFHTELKFNI
jgi:hypothetical protein